jgi:hypothetical protein
LDVKTLESRQQKETTLAREVQNYSEFLEKNQGENRERDNDFITERERRAKNIRQMMKEAQVESYNEINLGTLNFRDGSDRKTLKNLQDTMQRSAETTKQQIQVQQRQVTQEEIANKTNAVKTDVETKLAAVNDLQKGGVQEREQYNSMKAAVQEVSRLEQSGASKEDIEKASRKITEREDVQRYGLFSGTSGAFMMQALKNTFTEQGPVPKPIDYTSSESQQKIKEGIQQDRRTLLHGLEAAKIGDAAESGYAVKSARVKTDSIDLKGITGFTDAVTAVAESPELSKFLKDTNKINSKKRVWSEYEKAMRVLNDNITGGIASVTDVMQNNQQLFEQEMTMMNNIAGGHLAQFSPGQLKGTAQSLFSQARMMGQGTDYVNSMLANSSAMIGAAGINPAFVGQHAVISMATQNANMNNPSLLGVWGALDAQDVTDAQNKIVAKGLASRHGNQFGALLNIRERYGLKDDSNSARRLEAMKAGRATFDRTMIGSDGKTYTRQSNVVMTDAEAMTMMQQDVVGEADMLEISDIVNNRSANQQAAFRQGEITNAAVTRGGARANIQNEFSVSAMGTMTSARAQRDMFSGLKELKDVQGNNYSDAAIREQMQQVSDEATQQMFQIDLQRYAEEHGIDTSDPYYTGEIRARLEQEAWQKIQSPIGQFMSEQMSDESKRKRIAASYGSADERIAKKHNAESAAALYQIHGETSLRDSQKNMIRGDMESRAADSLRGSISQSLWARTAEQLGDGATPEQILRGALNILNVDEDSELGSRLRRFNRANDQLRQAQESVLNVQSNRDNYSTEEEYQKAEEAAHLAQKEAQVRFQEESEGIQPLLNQATSKYESMSRSQLDREIRTNTELMGAMYYPVWNKEKNAYDYKKLKPGENVKIDEQTGLLQIKEARPNTEQGYSWETADARTVSYMIREQHTDASGQDYFVNRALEQHGNQLYRRDENNQLVRVDPLDKNGPQVSVAQRLMTTATDEQGRTSVTASRYATMGGLLMKEGENGQMHYALNKSGQYIRMDSETGRKILEMQTAGHLDVQKIEEMIGTDNVTNEITVKEASEIESVALKEQQKTDPYSDEIYDIANRGLSSSTLIQEILPERTTSLEGKDSQGKVYEEFWTLGLHGNAEKKKQAYEKYYLPAKAKAAEKIEKFFTAKDEKELMAMEGGEAFAKDEKNLEAFRASKALEQRNKEIDEWIAEDVRLGGDENSKENKALRAEQEKNTQAIPSLKNQRVNAEANKISVAEQRKDIDLLQKSDLKVSGLNENLLKEIHGMKDEKGEQRWKEGQTSFTRAELTEMIGSLKTIQGKRQLTPTEKATLSRLEAVRGELDSEIINQSDLKDVGAGPDVKLSGENAEAKKDPAADAISMEGPPGTVPPPTPEANLRDRTWTEYSKGMAVSVEELDSKIAKLRETEQREKDDPNYKPSQGGRGRATVQIAALEAQRTRVREIEAFRTRKELIKQRQISADMGMTKNVELQTKQINDINAEWLDARPPEVNEADGQQAQGGQQASADSKGAPSSFEMNDVTINFSDVSLTAMRGTATRGDATPSTQGA